MNRQDSLSRFVFEGAGVRGEYVHLDASWRAVLDIHPYPPTVSARLGEALAAVALLAATIKFEGSLILQAQTEGPLRLLVAQGTHDRKIRGLARWDGDVPDGGLADVFGLGRLVLTVDPRGGERYQGIVALDGANLAMSLETYFARSEQLPTRLWLAAGEESAAGLLLQALPSEPGHAEGWRRVVSLADPLKCEELLGLPAPAHRGDTPRPRSGRRRVRGARAGRGPGRLRALQPPLPIRPGGRRGAVHRSGPCRLPRSSPLSGRSTRTTREARGGL